LPVLNTSIDIEHSGSKKTTMRNNGSLPLTWKASFMKKYKRIKAGGKSFSVNLERDKRGNEISYIEVILNPDQEIEVTVR
jgi:hypothetical protein